MVASLSAVVHYKSRFEQTVVRYSTTGGNLDSGYECTEVLKHESPIHPSWVVFTLIFDNDNGATFLPVDGGKGVPYNPDGGPAPKFVAMEWADGGKYKLNASGTYVLADGELTKWGDDNSIMRDRFGACLPKSAKCKLGLFVDIDGTLKGEGKLPSFVRTWERKMALDGAVLIFNTGRSEPSVNGWLDNISRMIVPTASIMRVGTEIRWFRDESGWCEEWTKDEEWTKQLAGLGGWKCDDVLERVRSSLEEHTKVKGRLCLPLNRSAQPLPHVTYIITFAIRRVWKGEAMRIVRRNLGDDIQVKMCVSGCGVDEQYLDIINIGAGKLGGLRWVAKTLLIKSENCVMCGDSGNDLDAICHDGDEKAIIVGNAESELSEYWNELNKSGQGNSGRVVMAKQVCAAGILEGLETLGFL